MRLADVSASGERFHFRIDVSNNSRTPTDVSLRTQLPQGWRREPGTDSWTIDAKSRQSLDVTVIVPDAATPGRYEIRAELSSPKLAAPIEFAQDVRFLPDSLNRIRNPGFEQGGANWSKNERGYEIDASESHSGRASLKLHNDSPAGRASASQTITLNQKTPRPIIVRGHAKADGVSGAADRGFSVYVDIYYTDGTPLYGQTIDWQTGSTEWQYAEMTIEPAKPIRNVNVYLLLRGKSGTARFDDLFVAEEPQQ
jgi:hypothetical protein